MARSSPLLAVATFAIVATLLVVVAVPSAAWSQLRGEADRSTVIVPPRGVLDIVSTAQALPTDGTWKVLGHGGPYAVTRPDGIGMVWTNDTPTCGIAVGQLTGGFTSPSGASGCADGWLQGYWEPGGLTLVCSSAPEHQQVLYALHANGTKAWSIIPIRDLSLMAVDGAAGLTSQTGEARWDWSCDGAAIIPGPTGEGSGDLLAVPFLATNTGFEGARHRIALIGLTNGAVHWSVSVSMAAAALQGAVLPELSSPSFFPTALTASFDPKGGLAGLLVTGLMPCPNSSSVGRVDPNLPDLPTTTGSPPCRAPEQESADARTGYVGAVAWLDKDGTTRGFATPLPQDEDPLRQGRAVTMRPMVSSMGAANGARFAVQVGSRILIIDPTRSEPEESKSVSISETEAAVGFLPAPLWQERRLLVPTDREIWFVDPVSFVEELAPYRLDSTASTERIVDLAGDSLGRLFILTADIPLGEPLSATLAGRNATVRVIDHGRTELHRLPIAGASTKLWEDQTLTDATWLQPPQFIQSEGTLAVVDAAGGIFTFGNRAGQAPTFAANLSDDYPPVDTDVTLTIRPNVPAEVERMLIRWDSGFLEDTEWPVGEDVVSRDHFYNSAGFKDALITLVYTDGTTATLSKTINVGGSPPPPPPDLNVLQRLFSNENANTTWGLIGIGLALAGGVIGVLQSRRARGHLRNTLHELQKIRERGKTDAMGAIEQLQELRVDVHDRAVAGSYDQAHLHMIESKAALTARLLMQQAIEPFRDRLTPIYQGMLAGFFEDGRLGAHEIEVGLRGLASQTRLRPAEKDTVRRIFVLLDGSA